MEKENFVLVPVWARAKQARVILDGRVDLLFKPAGFVMGPLRFIVHLFLTVKESIALGLARLLLKLEYAVQNILHGRVVVVLVLTDMCGCTARTEIMSTNIAL